MFTEVDINGMFVLPRSMGVSEEDILIEIQVKANGIKALNQHQCISISESSQCPIPWKERIKFIMKENVCVPSSSSLRLY